MQTIIEKPARIVSTIDSHNTLSAQFAKWIYEASKNGQVISKQAIAKQISRLKSGSTVTQGNVSSWIAKARFYCEQHLGCTLWNIPGEGWRVANSRETAVYYCKSVKKTIAWADRTLNLQAITDRREIPYAIKEVFCKAEGSIKTLSHHKKKYFEIWMNILKQQKEALPNGQKLIE